MSKVVGNTGGLKTAQLKHLERLGKKRIAPDLIVSHEMARSMAEISHITGRQVGVLIDRSGRVDMVIVGDARQIVIPALSGIRSSGGRLKGLRCIHTHLAGENLTDDDLVDLLFLRLDLMGILKIRPDGQPEKLYSAHLVPSPRDGKNWAFLEAIAPGQQSFDFNELITALEQEFSRLQPIREVDRGKDRAILISVVTPSRIQSRISAQESMDELVELARSDDVVVLDTVMQQRSKINPKYILGKGKLGEIMLSALRLNANLLLFNQELNPSQIRSITDHLELRVIDRTQLILDIFARRALSREGRLQIEMAQLKYMLPRLTKRDDALSRLTGGIGGRGPGETRLEIDRRRINDRIALLTKKLNKVSRERYQRRSRRRKKGIPVISLVGYTNAGKSTLLNTLTASEISAENKLFATLDPTSRRLRFPKDIEVIITDTVGFIRNLPAELLQAFKATLEELYEADMLVHVIDVSNPRFANQVAVVEKQLRELELDNIPCLKVLNKADLVEKKFTEKQCREYGAVALSALDVKTFGPFFDAAQKIIGRLGNQADSESRLSVN
ncbi:MAG: GTP-binding protein HflX [Desulfobacterales bacterium SG8_35_2]|nr:MAG: GTP-binding protein HflX [Desulfobacterales bacterium SG8_35_2]